MKIAFDAQLLLEKERTGIGWNSKALMDYIINTGKYDIQLNVFDFSRSKENNKILKGYERKGCKIKRNRIIPARVYYRLIRFIPIPYSWLFGKEADVTQFFNYTVPPGVGTRTGTFIYDMVYKAYPGTIQKKTFQWLNHMQEYCDRSDFIITISEFSKSEILRYLKVTPDKVHVVPCVIDHKQFRVDYSTEEITVSREKYGIPEKYLLYLGTLEPRKNISVLIEAYHILKETKINVPVLVIAGKKGWMYEEIFEKVRTYELEEDVIFTGYVAQEDSPKLMKGAQIFVFPSKYEGFGMPPLEAMACGTPVIVSDAASLPEAVGDAGIIVPADDPNALSNSLEKLIIDSKLRDCLIKKGLIWVKQFAAEEVSEQFIQEYSYNGGL